MTYSNRPPNEEPAFTLESLQKAIKEVEDAFTADTGLPPALMGMRVVESRFMPEDRMMLESDTETAIVNTTTGKIIILKKPRLEDFLPRVIDPPPLPRHNFVPFPVMVHRAFMPLTVDTPTAQEQLLNEFAAWCRENGHEDVFTAPVSEERAVELVAAFGEARKQKEETDES